MRPQNEKKTGVENYWHTQNPDYGFLLNLNEKSGFLTISTRLHNCYLPDFTHLVHCPSTTPAFCFSESKHALPRVLAVSSVWHAVFPEICIAPLPPPPRFCFCFFEVTAQISPLREALPSHSILSSCPVTPHYSIFFIFPFQCCATVVLY